MIEPINETMHEECSRRISLFHQGTDHRAYEYFGAHCEKYDGGFRYTFRVWAPEASLVTLNSDFTDWESGLPMTRNDDGVWEASVETETSLNGRFYKFAVTGTDGIIRLKADPYAFYSEYGAKTASIILDKTDFEWNDAEWMKKRSAAVCPKQRGFKPKVDHFYSAPLNIYELHLGSWKRGEDFGSGKVFLGYRDIADLLVPYLTEMGCTHAQIMPVMEHSREESLGYGITGYYAPTSRFGEPDDFRYLVNKLHENGIGVILDWMPVFFAGDDHGLIYFDGTGLYGSKKTVRDDGVTAVDFDFSKPEVRAFLISNALFWIREYHADGIRIGNVESDGGCGDEFWRMLNTAVVSEFPDVITSAVSSSDIAAKPVSEGGLGFRFRENTQWEQNMYRYISSDPIDRKYVHDLITKTPDYSFSENTILPLSHDGVTFGKKSILEKCFGEYDDKFASMRTMLLYMMTMPGKKLMFMGSEFAQFREWNSENELEWFMTDYPRHIEMQRFVRALGKFYLENKELWEIDDTEDGFEWIDDGLSELNVLAYRRKSKKGHEIIVILNFAPVVRNDFTIYVPKMGRYEELFTTDRYEFGGKNRMNEDAVRTKITTGEHGEKLNALDIMLPALGGIILAKQQNK